MGFFVPASMFSSSSQHAGRARLFAEYPDGHDEPPPVSDYLRSYLVPKSGALPTR